MSKTASLEKLALARFTTLTEAERRLVLAAPHGNTAYCGPSEDPDDPSNHPSDSDHWDQTREISAELIRWLCSNQAAKVCVDPRGIRICGARIRDSIDLSYVEIPFPLVLLQCRLSGHFNLDVTQIPDLDLTGTWVEELSAEYASVKGCIVLKEGFYASGPIELTGVHIGGNLECNGGRFENPLREKIETSGDALNGENARITGDVLLREGFSARGSVWLSGAEIGGNLECWGGKFENPGLDGVEGSGAADSGMALNADGARVHGGVLLSEEFSAVGAVSFDGAQIGGGLDCEGGKFKNPVRAGIDGSGGALTLVNAQVKGDIDLRGEFLAEGEVNLDGAQIGGNLDCDGGRFENPALEGLERSGIALKAVNAIVTGDVFLRGVAPGKGDANLGFSSKGEVNLDGARIGGVLDCDGGKFDNQARGYTEEGGTALKARSIRVGDSVFLGDGFSSLGAVDLDGAQIEGVLDCQHGNFENPRQAEIEGSGTALNARFIRVGDSVFLGNGPPSQGAVRMDKARVASRLELDGRAFEVLDLIDSSAASFVDAEESWPQAGNLSLDGFVYERISGGPIDAATRLNWLHRQRAFARQPYRQLAKVLRDAGDDEGWRTVCLEMERLAWKVRRTNEFGKWKESKIKGLLGGCTASLADYVLRWTIGYGYRSMKAVYLLALISLIWGAVYFVGFQVGSIVPTEEKNYIRFTEKGSVLPGYEQFHVAAYSIENSLPLIKLGVQDKWGPSPDIQAIPENPASWMVQRLRPIISPRFLRWFRSVQIGLGWLLTTFFVAGITGLIRKD